MSWDQRRRRRNGRRSKVTFQDTMRYNNNYKRSNSLLSSYCATDPSETTEQFTPGTTQKREQTTESTVSLHSFDSTTPSLQFYNHCARNEHVSVDERS